MNHRNNVLTFLALGSLLVMAAFAVAPAAYAQALIDVDVANVDCDQEQKTKQDSDQAQVNDQDINQTSDETLLSEQKRKQDTDQSIKNDLDETLRSLLFGEQSSAELTEQETAQGAANVNEQESLQNNEASQDCRAIGIV